MVGLGALAHCRLLDLDEIADLGLFLQHGAGAQPGKGADLYPGGQACPLDVAIGADLHIVGHPHPGAEEHVRFDQHVLTQHGIPGEPHRFGCDQRSAIVHRLLAAAVLPAVFGNRQFGARIDPFHLVRIGGDHHRAGPAIGVGDVDHIDQVIFALRVIVGDAGQQAEQVGAAHCHQARIAQPAAALGLAGILVLDHLHDPVALGDDAAISQRIGRLKAQHHHRRIVRAVQPLDHHPHRRRADEGNVAIKNKHVALEPGQRALRLLHRVAGAELRILHRDRRAVTQLRLELIAAMPGHHHRAGRRKFGGAGQQMLDHRPPGDRVQHLVQLAFHAGALAGGEGDDCEGGIGSAHG